MNGAIVPHKTAVHSGAAVIQTNFPLTVQSDQSAPPSGVSDAVQYIRNAHFERFTSIETAGQDIVGCHGAHKIFTVSRGGYREVAIRPRCRTDDRRIPDPARPLDRKSVV